MNLNFLLGLVILPVDMIIYWLLSQYLPQNNLVYFVQTLVLTAVNFYILKYIFKF